MKKISLLLAILLFLPLFGGCEKKPSMSELLQYEQEAMRFTLAVTDKTTHAVTLTLGKEQDIFSFTDTALAGTQVIFHQDGKVELSYDDYKTPLPSSSLLKALRWKELFHLSEKNFLWRIQKETLGGLAVYVCRAEDITVYIDAASFLPLKITQNKLVIDITCAENQSPVIPRAAVFSHIGSYHIKWRQVFLSPFLFMLFM